jgi:hypothetical protein
MSKDSTQISSIGVRHDPMTYSSQMFVYEASNYSYLQVEKVVYIFKRQSFSNSYI